MDVLPRWRLAVRAQVGRFPLPCFPQRGIVELKAKSGKSLNRFFPDMVCAIAELPETKLAVDGELLIAVDGDSASTRCSCACIHVRHVCSS